MPAPPSGLVACGQEWRGHKFLLLASAVESHLAKARPPSPVPGRPAFRLTGLGSGAPTSLSQLGQVWRASPVLRPGEALGPGLPRGLHDNPLLLSCASFPRAIDPPSASHSLFSGTCNGFRSWSDDSCLKSSLIRAVFQQRLSGVRMAGWGLGCGDDVGLRPPAFLFSFLSLLLDLTPPPALLFPTSSRTLPIPDSQEVSLHLLPPFLLGPHRASHFSGRPGPQVYNHWGPMGLRTLVRPPKRPLTLSPTFSSSLTWGREEKWLLFHHRFLLPQPRQGGGLQRGRGCVLEEPGRSVPGL